MFKKISAARILLIASLISSVAATPSVLAKSDNAQKPASREEQEFTFAGRCQNGDSYRMFAYQMHVDGQNQPFYDYEGPAGKGTVQSNASPKKFAVRLCRALADIHSGSRFE